MVIAKRFTGADMQPGVMCKRIFASSGLLFCFLAVVGVCADGIEAGQSPTTWLTGFNYKFLIDNLCWLLVMPTLHYLRH